MPDASVERSPPAPPGLEAPAAPQALLPSRPEDLPHGLLVPPKEVLELREQERAKFPPEVFARTEQRQLCIWTVAFYFEGLGHEVLYRETPQGPEVLAVGSEEKIALRKSWPLEMQKGIQVFRGY